MNIFPQEEPKESKQVERDPEPKEPEVQTEKPYEPKRVIENIEKGMTTSDKTTSKSFFLCQSSEIGIKNIVKYFCRKY